MLKLFSITILILLSTHTFSQSRKEKRAKKDSMDMMINARMYKDSIVFETGHHIIGKIKEVDLGVMRMKTKYSKSDFNIKWLKIEEFYSQSPFAIALEKGRKVYGHINMDTSGARNIIITLEDSTKVRANLADVTYIKRIDRKFWDRIKANIDVGYTWTKANNSHQISLNGGIKYYGRKLNVQLNMNTVQSLRESASAIRRTEGSTGMQVFMPKDFYYFLGNNLLSNTEQKIRLRSNIATGFGYYYVNSNKMTGSIGLGAAWNNETFKNDSITRNSIESFIGLSYQIFNIGNLYVNTYLNTFPNLTNWGRVRMDFKAESRYKWPFNLYIGASFTLNYDNKPTTDASRVDYVLQTSIGWSW